MGNPNNNSIIDAALLDGIDDLLKSASDAVSASNGSNNKPIEAAFVVVPDNEIEDILKLVVNEVDKKKAAAKEIPPAPAVAIPDPFWPVDAVPVHLTPQQKADALEVGSFASLKALDWTCSKCGTENSPSRDNPALCTKCAIEEKQSTTLMKKTNSSWMDDAKALGLELFERQPEETATEWRVWETYRNFYPMKLPTYSQLAAAAQCSVSTVVTAAQRWNFKVRIIEWARHCDSSSQTDRVKAVAELNTAQLTLAEGMLQKVCDAISKLQPEFMKPNEIVNMAKLATEMQRKIVESKPEKVEQPAIVDRTTAEQAVTKPEELSEIAEILTKMGVLDAKTIGIERTTRVVVMGGDDE